MNYSNEVIHYDVKKMISIIEQLTYPIQVVRSFYDERPEILLCKVKVKQKSYGSDVAKIVGAIRGKFSYIK